MAVIAAVGVDVILWPRLKRSKTMELSSGYNSIQHFITSTTSLYPSTPYPQPYHIYINHNVPRSQTSHHHPLPHAPYPASRRTRRRRDDLFRWSIATSRAIQDILQHVRQVGLWLQLERIEAIRK